MQETYAPRRLTPLGIWSTDQLQLKVYGLTAESQSLDRIHDEAARAFIQNEVLDAVASTGDSNDVGFVIIHPGSLGLSVSVHWWTQGSVLCQRFYRKLYDAKDPLDMSARASIGCVWELAVIEAERKIWVRSMMNENPDANSYLAKFTDLKEV